MPSKDIFVSVGAPANTAQEEFVCAVEDRLRSEGFAPRTIGRSAFSVNAPLVAVIEELENCAGTVVVALERVHFPAGIERRYGPKERALQDISLPTPWNQIEAALSYSHGLPLLVIVAEGMQKEGLLERGYDWYVLELKPEPDSLRSMQFNAVFASWKKKVAERPDEDSAQPLDMAQLSIGQLIAGLKPAQLHASIVAIATLVSGAFAAGVYLAN